MSQVTSSSLRGSKRRRCASGPSDPSRHRETMVNATSTENATRLASVRTNVQKLARMVLVSTSVTLLLVAHHMTTGGPGDLNSYAVVFLTLVVLATASVVLAYNDSAWYVAPLLNVGTVLLVPAVLSREVTTSLFWLAQFTVLLLLAAVFIYTEWCQHKWRREPSSPGETEFHAGFWREFLREEQPRTYRRLNALERKVLIDPSEASVFELMHFADLALRRPEDEYAPGDYVNTYAELARRDMTEIFKQALARSYEPPYPPSEHLPFVIAERQSAFAGFLYTASDLALMRRLEKLTVDEATDLSAYERAQRKEEVKQLEAQLGYRGVGHLYTLLKAGSEARGKRHGVGLGGPNLEA